MERVVPLARPGADEEVAWHPDARERQTAAPAHLDHEHAQGDRDTESPVEHRVEERIARVAVVDLVAGKAALHEQELRERTRLGLGRIRGERVELREARADVEIGVRVRGDQERRLVEGDVGLGTAHELDETSGGVHERTVPLPADGPDPAGTLRPHGGDTGASVRGSGTPSRSERPIVEARAARARPRARPR